jgi:undecaprenyl-diphosphatase
MSGLQALLLGLVQGLTEFFPVSSSSHLKLLKTFLHIQETQGFVLFELMCHFGTIIAATLFFRHDIFRIFTTGRKDLKVFFLALVPMPIGYLLLKHTRDWIVANHLLGYFLIITAAALFIGQWLHFSTKRIPCPKKWYQDALLIGAMQSCALLPGISRSALTISTARALGWETKEAVRFSFLLSIPAILGGNLFQLMKSGGWNSLQTDASFSLCTIGFLASSITGLATIRFAIHYLEKGNLNPFAWYCLGLGALTFFIYHYG